MTADDLHVLRDAENRRIRRSSVLNTYLRDNEVLDVSEATHVHDLVLSGLLMSPAHGVVELSPSGERELRAVA